MITVHIENPLDTSVGNDLYCFLRVHPEIQYLADINASSTDDTTDTDFVISVEETINSCTITITNKQTNYSSEHLFDSSVTHLIIFSEILNLLFGDLQYATSSPPAWSSAPQ